MVAAVVGWLERPAHTVASPFASAPEGEFVTTQRVPKFLIEIGPSWGNEHTRQVCGLSSSMETALVKAHHIRTAVI